MSEDVTEFTGDGTWSEESDWDLELAGAADLVMGKSDGIAAAIVRGVDPAWLDTTDLDHNLAARTLQEVAVDRDRANAVSSRR